MLLVTVCYSVNAEIFSSTAHIQKTVKFIKQTKFSDLFKNVFDKQKFRRAVFQDILNQSEQIQKLLNMDDFNSHHPLDIFRFIRFCNELQQAKTVLDKLKSAQNDADQIKQYIEKIPTYKDLEGSAVG